MGSITVGPALERILHLRRPMIVLAHAVLVALAYWLAFALRFEFRLLPDELSKWSRTLPFVLVVRLLVFQWFHLYVGLWRYVSMRDIVVILKAGTLSSVILSAGILSTYGRAFPLSVLMIDWLLCLALVGGVRLTLRVVRESQRRGRNGEGRRALIVGAGDAGEILLRELGRSSVLEYDILGFVDDEAAKQHMRIHDIEVIGTVDQLDTLTRSLRVQEILIAIPSAIGEERRRILDRCRASRVPFRTVPPLDELLSGRAQISQLQEVRPEDLLGRKEIRLDFEQIRHGINGRRVLVTGAAGSIGSQLSRQLATFEPETLVLFDRAESGLYFAELELRRRHKDLRIVPVVGDILDRRKVEEVLDAHSPEVVYHTAAYKHVPLMEEHPLEAIENNVFGTEIVARASQERKVKRFVLISTDKAVNPVAIMGMTKRLAECLLLSLNGFSTAFVTVRFGNVLGTDGSVLPVFHWQMSCGGPVTITDPDASRYFMLPAEAAQLVLQAGAMGTGGEVFLLDMGEPIRIVDLAENLIRLSGLEPGRDIPIEVMGLRPGERLREELVLANEQLLPTAHEKVFMVRNHSFDSGAFRRDFELLRSCVQSRDRARAVPLLREMASRY